MVALLGRNAAFPAKLWPTRRKPRLGSGDRRITQWWRARA